MFLLLFRHTIVYSVSFFLLFSIPLFATNLTYTNITESIYKNNKLYLTINAHKKVENSKKDLKTLFLNRKKYIADNFYYKDGSIENKDYRINFKRMFIYGQNIYMHQVRGSFFKYTFRAKSAVVYKNRIVFSHIFFKSIHKKGSKLKFIYYFDKKNEI